jgi:hypothetical protein
LPEQRGQRAGLTMNIANDVVSARHRFILLCRIQCQGKKD